MKSFEMIDFSAVQERYGKVLESGEPKKYSESDLREIWMEFVLQRPTCDFLKPDNIRFVLQCFALGENGDIFYTEQGEKMMVEAARTEESYILDQNQYKD